MTVTTHHQFRWIQLLGGFGDRRSCLNAGETRTGAAPRTALLVTLRRGAASVSGTASVGKRNPLRWHQGRNAERREPVHRLHGRRLGIEGRDRREEQDSTASRYFMMILPESGGTPLVSCE